MASLNELFAVADAQKDKINHGQFSNKPELAEINNNLKTVFTYSSNALAGNTLTLAETEAVLKDGVILEGKSQKDCYEAMGHGDAYDFMLALARQEDMAVTETLIKKLHYYFYRKIDGTWAGVYRDKAASSATGHIPPGPEELDHLMSHFIAQIETSKSVFHPIELIAITHKRLIDIHPFVDGNGRVARLLMNLMFFKAGYGIVPVPPTQKEVYMAAVKFSQTKNDPEPLVKLIAECLLEAQQDYCRGLHIV